MINTFKHSGTLGDLIYGLPIMKYLGGGKLFLHLNQINWIGQHYYGSMPAQVHQGRMNMPDYSNLKDLMLDQPYISDFQVLNERNTEITHNLDRFRTTFVQHPGNYVDCYANTFNIKDPAVQETLRNTPWLSVANKAVLPPGKDIVISRTERWLPPTLSPLWQDWKEQGLEERSLFVGTSAEYAKFTRDIGWQVTYLPTNNLLTLANIIASANVFIGNQGGNLSLAIGLGIPEIWVEARRDLPLERNECFFKDHPSCVYF